MAAGRHEVTAKQKAPMASPQYGILYRIIRLIISASFCTYIDNAFRRVPVAPEHRKFCGIAFMHQKRVFSAVHFSCPLGTIGAVLAWERVGAAILHIAR
eukprot:7383678-Karenia_brevis.AAC.1